MQRGRIERVAREEEESLETNAAACDRRSINQEVVFLIENALATSSIA